MIAQGIKLNLGGDRKDLFDQFFLAIGMKEYELAAACLRYRPVMKWSAKTNVSDQPTRCPKARGTLRLSVFDVSALSYGAYRRLDPEIAWTLLRSASLAKLAQNDQTFEENYGDEFLKLMRIQCECFSDDMMVF